MSQGRIDLYMAHEKTRLWHLLEITQFKNAVIYIYTVIYKHFTNIRPPPRIEFSPCLDNPYSTTTTIHLLGLARMNPVISYIHSHQHIQYLHQVNTHVCTYMTLLLLRSAAVSREIFVYVEYYAVDWKRSGDTHPDAAVEHGEAVHAV